MGKEKEIEEIYNIIASNISVKLLRGSTNAAIDYKLLGISNAAKKVTDVCYRKANETHKETVKEIANFLRDTADHMNNIFGINALIFNDLADKIEDEFGEMEE